MPALLPHISSYNLLLPYLRNIKQYEGNCENDTPKAMKALQVLMLENHVAEPFHGFEVSFYKRIIRSRTFKHKLINVNHFVKRL